MVRHAAPLALLVALLAAPLAHAAPPTEPSLLRAAPSSLVHARPADDARVIDRGLARAVKAKRLTKSEAAHYRTILERTRAVLRGLPATRKATLAQVLYLVRLQAGAFTKPRALALFSMLDENARYLKEHALPADGTDVVGVARGRLPGRLGLRAPVPSARERRRAERPRRRRTDEAGEGARERAHRPGRPARQGRGVGVLLPVRGRRGAVDGRDGAGRRRASARPRGKDDRGATGVRRDPPDSRPAPRRGPLDPALQLQQPGRPERAAPDGALAARVRGEVRQQARGAAREQPRRDRENEAPRVRHGLLDALLAGARIAARLPRVRRRDARPARPAHRPAGLAGDARPLRRLHRPAAAPQARRARSRASTRGPWTASATAWRSASGSPRCRP